MYLDFLLFYYNLQAIYLQYNFFIIIILESLVKVNINILKVNISLIKIFFIMYFKIFLIVFLDKKQIYSLYLIISFRKALIFRNLS